jgi:hypothetical protein
VPEFSEKFFETEEGGLQTTTEQNQIRSPPTPYNPESSKEPENPLLGGVSVAIVLKVKRKEKNSQPPNEQNKMAALDIRFHH